MSLQIWLPLDGNTNNLGLLGDAAITGNVGFASTGKIGTKSMNSGKLTLSAKDADKILNNEAFSYCCWIYVNADPGTTAGCSAFFGRENMNSDGNRQFTMFQYNNVNSFHWSWQNDFVTDSSIFTGGGVLSDVFPSRKWTHFAMAYKKGEYKFYTNGNCIYTGNANSNSLSFSYSLPIVVCSSARYLNDVRLYDHCLSPKEVKEISNGLICNYKFSDVYCTNSINKYSGDSAEGKPVSSSSEFAIKKIDNERGYNFKLDYTGTGNNAWFNFQYPVFSFTAGKTYDYSCKVRINSVSNITMYFRAARMNNDWVATQTQVVKNVGQWTEYHLQIKLEAKSDRSGTTYDTKPCVEFYTSSLATANTKYTIDFDIKDVQVAETTGNNEIPFSDSNFKSNIEYDTSGYQNDGKITNSNYISANTVAPRYDSCYKLLNGASVYVTSPDFNFESMSQGTVSMWLNRHSTDSTWRNYLLFANAFNWTGSEYDFIIYGSTGEQGITMDCCSCTYTFTPELNTWYLYTLSWDLTTHTAKFYINGELKGSKTDNKIGITYASKHGQHYIGNASYQTSDYSISDFRLYTTVLSDTDIKELYNTPISLTNTGTLMTQGEFKEA